MKTLGQVLQLSSEFLEKKEIPYPKRCVEEMLAHLLQCKRLDLYLHFDLPLEKNELDHLRHMLKRAANHEPVAYILGRIEFFGTCLKVDSRVLIPRQETELLVEAVSKNISQDSSLLDLCTGSGCIAISLKKKFENLQVTGSDLSQDALDLAKENAKRNEVSVHWVQGNLFEPIEGCKFDVIVCNPPYVSEKEYRSLEPSVKNFEPKCALVAKEEGFEFYRKIAERASHFLNAKGKLFLEIGYMQGKMLENIFSSSIWASRQILQDLSGRDRFFFLEKQ